MTCQVSAIVMTKNEEANIVKCLRSLVGIDQIFIVDSRSEDRTREIAIEAGAIVVDFVWNGRYPKKKQWCLANLPFKHDWVFFVDADEEATPALIDEIRNAVSSHGDAAGFFVGYNYTFMGRTLRHGARVFKLVLFDRHRGRFEPCDDLDATNMWEVEGHYQPVIDGPVRKLRTAMLHTDHDSLFRYFERHNLYSDWEAVVRSKGRYQTSGETQFASRGRLKSLFDRLPLKAPAAFAYTYVLKRGFLDGRAGFHYALAKAFYYWQVELKTEELKRSRNGQG